MNAGAGPPSLRAALWRLWWRARDLFAPAQSRSGRLVPDFALEDVAGRVQRLHVHFPRRPVLLWLTNLCGDCQTQIPFLNELADTTRQRLAVIAVSLLGGDRETARRVAAQSGARFSILLDPQDWVAKVLGLPHAPNACPLHNLLLLDSTGHEVLRTHLSAVDKGKLREAVRELTGA